MIGQSCYMPRFDCNVRLPQEASFAALNLEAFLPRVELALIQEATYKKIYSSDPDQSEMDLRRNVSHLGKKLDDWALKHRNFFEARYKKSSTVDTFSGLRMEFQANIALTYHFHITRLMVYRPSNDLSDKIQCWEDAVACVRALEQLGGDSKAETGLIMLRQ